MSTLSQLFHFQSLRFSCTQIMYSGGRYRRRGSSRGRGNRNFFDDSNNPHRSGEGPSNSGQGHARGHNRHGRRSGREIGMYYAQRSRANKKNQEKNNMAVVRMNAAQMGTAHSALKQVGNTEESDEMVDHLTLFEDDFAASRAQAFQDRKYSWFQPSNSDPGLDKTLLKESQRKLDSPSFKKMQEIRARLPSIKMRKDLVEIIDSNQVVVISGETGCGKTTQIPQYILDDAISKGAGSTCKIVCTQPRRISAISIAQRVSQERDEACGRGNSCGYQIRLQSELPRQQASILYCTTGILIQWLQSDPQLSRVSHVILDEIHERDLHSDFLIALIKNIVAIRKDLKVILMSATLNAEQFAEYFGNCPKVNIPGYTFPVKQYYLEEVMETIKYEPPDAAFDHLDRMQSGKRNWKQMRSTSREERAEMQDEKDAYLEGLQQFNNQLKTKYPASLSNKICTMDAFLQKNIDVELIGSLIRHLILHPMSEEARGGAILVFLPGWEDIKKLNELITADRRFFSPDKFRVIPLHSMMPTVNQQQVFDKPPPGVTKIVMATNIAETSITIDDIVYVIDCGKIKMTHFNTSKDLNVFAAHWGSKANARQRKGRSGRVQAGFCFHLFTKLQESKMEEFMTPEILRTPLEQLCLQIKILRLGTIKDFLSKVMEPPEEGAVELSVRKLTSLGALNHDESLTPLGYHLARLPVPPQIGKMLLMGSMFQCVDPILTIAASLSFKQPFVFPLGKEKEADARRKRLAGTHNSDHLMLVEAYNEWTKSCSRGDGEGREFCWRNFMSPSILKMLKEMRNQFLRHLRDTGFVLSSQSARDLNLHSRKPGILEAVICAGLYPNVAKLTKKKPERPPKLSSRTERRLCFHPKSVNSFKPSGRFNQQWVVYYEKLKSMEINLLDSSEVSPYPILFFGGDIRSYKDEEETDMIAVDDWIEFKASPEVAATVQQLRRELDKILAKKIKEPFCDLDSSDHSVLNAIIEILSSE